MSKWLPVLPLDIDPCPSQCHLISHPSSSLNLAHSKSHFPPVRPPAHAPTRQGVTWPSYTFQTTTTKHLPCQYLMSKGLEVLEIRLELGEGCKQAWSQGKCTDFDSYSLLLCAQHVDHQCSKDWFLIFCIFLCVVNLVLILLLPRIAWINIITTKNKAALRRETGKQ